MQFWSYGPFSANPLDKTAMWSEVREAEDYEGLETNAIRDSIGCYVFVMQRGKKLLPWYVGKTNAKTGFYREVFADHKVSHYSSIIEWKTGWRPKMLLFPLITSSGRFSAAYKTNKPLIEWMERTLIGMALSKNPDLYNKRDTKMLKNCIVDGVFGDFSKNQRYPAAIAARSALTDHDDWDHTEIE